MKYIKKNKNICILTVLVVFMLCISIVFYSCEEAIFTGDIDCDECFTEKPDSGDLIIEFSEEYFETNGILIYVYEGNVEDNQVIFIDTVYTEIFYLYVPVNKYYSVKTYYLTSNNTKYTIINGTNLKVKHVTDECNESCWVFAGQDVDMRVRYHDYFK